MVITATRTGNKTWLAANCTADNMMGPKQSSTYFEQLKAKLANRY